MKKKTRSYCPYCGKKVVKTDEDGVLRDFCEGCRVFFYENPLPVVSAIVASARDVLLVKRGKVPYKGHWCLPTGFAETGESVEDAALRELKEETGLQGKIIRLVDVDSAENYYYGDLIFTTFEVKSDESVPSPGGDTVAARYFSLDRLPKLAFSSNKKAIAAYLRSKKELWAIVDSFSKTFKESGPRAKKQNVLSDSIIDVIEQNAETIAKIWIADVTTNRSTPSYHNFDLSRLISIIHKIFSQLGKWFSGDYSNRDIRKFYMALGREMRKEGIALSEALSAVSLVRKHASEFAFSHGLWQEALDIYTVLELDRRILMFFDKASFYTTRGFES
jgi:ADP-ribose pyrophosphatase YjhB (NUDIX family)